MKRKSTNPVRCTWANNPLSIRYHDKEWGVPTHQDKRLFEFLILESAQAGLSWDEQFRGRCWAFQYPPEGRARNRMAQHLSQSFYTSPATQNPQSSSCSKFRTNPRST